MLMSLPQKLFLGFWSFIVPNCLTVSPLFWSLLFAQGSMFVSSFLSFRFFTATIACVTRNV